ncbi:MAG TPA: DNA translocase FtsK 4TM domain-containing protein, partial [Acidimicrobiales bacterium]|nr:DNA translocase FtsK 4TM domain-containing protein [Acidimicrobiales bacterium]
MPPDVWGGALLVAGALAALGVYTNLVGPTGRGINQFLGDAVGVGKFLVPVALAVVGVTAIRDETGRGPARLALGSVLALIATSGLADDVGGPAHGNHQVAALRSAGGVLGAVVGIPLRAGLAVWGAGFILVLVGLLSVLVLTASPPRLAVARVARAGSAAARLVSGLRHRIGREPASDDEAGGGDDRPRRPGGSVRAPFDPHAPTTAGTGGTAGDYGVGDVSGAPTSTAAKAGSVPIVLPPTPAEEAAAAGPSPGAAQEADAADADPEQLR